MALYRTTNVWPWCYNVPAIKDNNGDISSLEVLLSVDSV